MKYIFFSLLSMIVFSGCAVSSLSFSDANTLALEYDTKHVKIAENVLDARRQWYENIDIRQYKVGSKNNILFYEHIELNSDWEFIFGPITTLKYIFEGVDAKILYKDSSITLVQLSISDVKHINILMESSGFHDMSYVYGFNDSEFLALADSLGKVYTKENLKKDTNTLVLGNDTTHMSKWSVTMLFLRPLIKLSFNRVSNY